MERVDAGIVGGGLITEDVTTQDWERRIAERSERLYRARLLRRFLLLWLYPGNALLVLFTLLATVLTWPSPVLPLAGFAVLAASGAIGGRLTYLQHLRVRSVRAELRTLETAYREQRLAEVDSDDLLGTQKRYRAELPEIISRYRAAAREDRRKDAVLQSVVIGGSIIAATTSGLAMSLTGAHWGAVVLSLLVAVAAAFAGYGQFRERAATWQRTADALEREYEAVELRVGRYRRFGDERDAYAEFADAVLALRGPSLRSPGDDIDLTQ
ncbi:SLATT domain-containing protein [Bounagaea algeriensis]